MIKVIISEEVRTELIQEDSTYEKFFQEEKGIVWFRCDNIYHSLVHRLDKMPKGVGHAFILENAPRDRPHPDSGRYRDDEEFSAYGTVQKLPNLNGPATWRIEVISKSLSKARALLILILDGGVSPFSSI
ncbi:MAG TPA: hypothetical protein VLE93_02430 [Candidatus Saccharimonadales bacterium]|nr:hypothetical protein [Candidatus Saccharimonadales bacterium]